MESWHKPMTRLGLWMKERGLSAKWLIEQTGLNKNTVTRCITDINYKPYEKTKQHIIIAIKQHDPNINISDFW